MKSDDSTISRILFLHTGAELYGADNILLFLTSSLDRERFEPIVVLPEDGPLVSKLRSVGVRTEVMSYPIIRRRMFNPYGITKYLIEYFRAVRALTRFSRDNNIDIVHSNTVAVLEGVTVSKRIKKPLVVHVHEIITHPMIVARFLYGFLLRKSNHVIVVSDAVKKHIEKVLRRHFGNIEVIHNGITVPNVVNQKRIILLRKELDIPTNAIVVAMIGRINAFKGQDHFIEMMEQIAPSSRFIYGLIVGDAFSGQEWRVADLKKKIEESGISDRLRYCGFRTDVSDIYDMIDCFVLPSVDYDPFPTVVLEAMSHAKPVVAYRCGGVEEMIKNGVNGYLVRMRDVKDLSEHVLNVVKNGDKKMGELAKKTIEDKFSLKRFITDFEKMYEKVVDESKAE